MSTKDREKAQAKKMFIDLGMLQKDIAATLKVRESTISKWVKEGNWKSVRTAQMTSNEAVLNNGKMAVSNLSDILLDLQKQRTQYESEGNKEEVARCDASILSIADAISKTASSVAKFEKQNAITLTVYLSVMESIFKALLQEDAALHHQTLDFQERHIQEMAKILG